MDRNNPHQVIRLPDGASIVPSGSASAHPLRSGYGNSDRLVEGGPDSLTVSRVTLDAGTPQGPFHIHERAENTYLVLAGRLDVVTSDETYTLAPGDAIFIPPGVAHATHDPWPEPATFLAIYDRSTVGDFIRVDQVESEGRA
jgi:quercetin dioxygenase-like cupin family protein